MSEPRGPSPTTLMLCIAAWQRARASLERDEALVDDEDAIREVLAADPEAIDPDDILRRLVWAITLAELRAGAAAAMAKINNAVRQRYLDRAQGMRGELLAVLEALRRQNFSTPYGTAYLQTVAASPVITDIDALPDAYVIKTVVKSPDRKALLNDLSEGLVIDGAVLSNPSTTVGIRRPRSAVPDDGA